MSRSALGWVLLMTLSACASTGIVSVDRDLSLVHKKSAQPLFGSPDAVVADLYREAGKHCRDRGLVVETVELNTERTVLLSPGSATLKFRCIAAPAGTAIKSQLAAPLESPVVPAIGLFTPSLATSPAASPAPPTPTPPRAPRQTIHTARPRRRRRHLVKTTACCYRTLGATHSRWPARRCWPSVSPSMPAAWRAASAPAGHDAAWRLLGRLGHARPGGAFQG